MIRSTKMRNFFGPARQKGSTLIIALFFLLIMTLIGTTAMQSTTQQERMAGNFWDQNLAFQAAEAALAFGGRKIVTGGSIPLPIKDYIRVEDQSAAWWNNDSNATPVAIKGVSAAPRYVTQNIGASTDGGLEFGVTPSFVCRVVARSTGGSGNAMALLEEIRECG